MRSGPVVGLVAALALVAGIAVWVSTEPPTIETTKPAAKPTLALDPGVSDALAPQQPRAASGSPIERYSARIRVDARWLATVSERSGIPRRPLRAYVRATLALAKYQPTCHLGWVTVAALAYEESRHGTLGGSSIDAHGIVTPVILGPLLDGRRFDAVADTDRGRLDGSSAWDRAVGPLQFIPDTWTRRGLDADGDGKANPNDINDAALTAADYVCASGADLRVAARWNAAILSFNQNTAYLDRVRTDAQAYSTRATG
jgi:hypothetical protein